MARVFSIEAGEFGIGWVTEASSKTIAIRIENGAGFRKRGRFDLALIGSPHTARCRAKFLRLEKNQFQELCEHPSFESVAVKELDLVDEEFVFDVDSEIRFSRSSEPLRVWNGALAATLTSPEEFDRELRITFVSLAEVGAVFNEKLAVGSRWGFVVACMGGPVSLAARLISSEPIPNVDGMFRGTFLVAPADRLAGGAWRNFVDAQAAAS